MFLVRSSSNICIKDTINLAYNSLHLFKISKINCFARFCKISGHKFQSMYYVEQASEQQLCSIVFSIFLFV